MSDSVKWDWDSDDDRVLQSMKRIEAAILRTENRTKGLADTSKQGASQTVQDLARIAAGYFSVQAAVNVAKMALESYNREQERGRNVLAQGASPLAKLAQVSPGGSADLNQNIQGALASARQAGSLEAGAQLQFDLVSTGLQGDRELFASLYPFTNAATVVQGVATLQGAFGNREVGGTRAAINKLFAGSGASKFDQEQFIKGLSTAGAPAAAIGTSDEEAIAVLSGMTKGLKSADVAGEKIKSLSEAIAKKGLGTGRGLLSDVDALNARGLSQQGMIKLLGEANSASALSLINTNRGDINTILDGVQAGNRTGPGDFVDTMVGAVAANPFLRADLQNLQTRTAADIEYMQHSGIKESDIDTLQEELRRRSLKSGSGFLKRFAGEMDFRMTRVGTNLMGSSPDDQIRQLGAPGKRLLLDRSLDEEQVPEVVELFRRMVEGINKTAENTDTQRRSGQTSASFRR